MFYFKYQGFGNWAFSVAFAGGYGYEPYIQYSNTVDGNNPYVEGAPITTGGHQITARVMNSR